MLWVRRKQRETVDEVMDSASDRRSINQYQHQNLGFTSGTPGRLNESNFNCVAVSKAKRQEVLHQDETTAAGNGKTDRAIVPEMVAVLIETRNAGFQGLSRCTRYYIIAPGPLQVPLAELTVAVD
ncbi:hypothetical protein B0H14DRAFT_2602867 [Mycena olivaceomarginata]|nr:hypothetical protein B0H14DRAFT_2602867 [Mycena olivaceomarginata]